jgi:D-alanine-D-alanine ligase
MATRVLMVFDLPYAVKPNYDFAEEFADPERSYTENDVYRALLECGYEVHRLSLFDDIRPLLDAVRDVKPDVIFNLCETYRNAPHWDKNIVATMELLGIPCTGANSSALFLCNDKGLCKKILRFHRVRVPRFHTFYRGHKVWLPKTLKLPCIVKPLTEEASRGISQASVVDDETSFLARIKMIHERMNLEAIAEEYIEGRELYVSIIGDRALRVLPAREMTFGQMAEDEPRIATYKAKWDDNYRKRWGIKNHFAKALEPELQEHIDDVCKRAYRALNIRSYARFDLRVTEAGNVYVIEPNANPCIAKDDELAQSALKAGMTYPGLIRKVVNQALRRKG